MNKNTAESFLKNLIKFQLVICISTLFCATKILGQDIQFTENNNAAVSVKSGIDPSSLGLSISIQLADYPGRKGMNMPVEIKYTSKVWHIEYSGSFSLPNEPEIFYTTAYAQFDGGWTSNLQPPRFDYESSGVYFDEFGKPIDITNLWYPNGDPRVESYYYIPRINIRMPDDSLHEFRKGDWAYEKFVQSPQPIPQYVYEGIFYATDSTGMKYNTVNKTLYLADGSRYVGDTYGNFLTYIDRNGNTLNYSQQTGGWVDTLGRSISIPTLTSNSVQDINYAVKGINGSDINYSFHYRQLSDIRTNPNDSLRYIGDRQSPRDVYPTYSPSLFQSGDTCVCNIYSQSLFNPILLHEIVLSNGTSYKFNYNVWGEIDKITYPSGGYERFRYDEVAATSFVSSPYSQSNRGVIEKWVSKDGNSASEVHWRYSNQPVTQISGNYQYVTEIAPDNTKTERLFYSAGYSQTIFGLEDPKIGLLAEERVYDSSGLMLRRRLKDYEISGPSYDQEPISRLRITTAKRNPRAIKESEIMLDTGTGPALISTQTSQYDSDLNIIFSREYNFAEISNRTFAETGSISSLPQGTLLRTTEFDYLRGGSYPNIRGLRTLMKITDANGVVAEKNEIFYDESPLQYYSGQFVGWTDPGTNFRGNATTMRRWIDSTNFIDVHSTYDIFGNEVTVSDGLGNTATLEYSNQNQYAYQTKTISPPADLSGTTGRAVPSQSITDFDFWTGLILSKTDANNRVTTYEYNDSLNRLTKIISPDGGWTAFTYGDTPNNLYLYTQMSQDASQTIEKYEYFDGLKRLRRTSSNEGSSWSIQDFEYDSTGREWRVSNSFRDSVPNGTINPLNLWKTKQYDALDRVISVTAPDGGVVTSVYSGNTVVIRDEGNKTTKSIADVLGRNLQVIEAPGSSTPYITDYTYDVVGNLRSVTQASTDLGVVQKRYFMFDQLSRLIRVKNPEENVNSSLNLYDGITGNSDWSKSFEYDNNDNPTIVKDARGVIANYSYDKLNRKTQCNYSTPVNVAATPTVNYFYDGAGVSGGIQNSIGILTKVSSSVSTITIDEIDVVGRVKKTTQSIDGKSFAMSYDYDLAGHIISQTYPTGRIVKNTFDRAARLKEITGQLPNQSFSKTYLSQITYAPHWGMTSMKLGNNLREQVEFNTNLQRTKIKLGHSLGDSSLGSLENVYTTGTVGNNGNLRKQIISFGGQSITQEFTFDNYDRLLEAKENNGASWMQKFTYDRFGNRRIDSNNTTQALIGYNPSINPADNRIINYSYDSGGNVILDPLGHTFTFDANNLLTAFDNGTATYAYDGNGRRAKKTVAGVTSYFIYNIVGQMVAEYTTVTPNQEGTKYLTADHTGGSRIITNVTGQIVERRDYLPFGEEIGAGYGGRASSQGYGVSTNIKQKFTGKERDEETGFDFFGARYYSSNIGRFTSPDPLLASAVISDPQTWNRYAYVTNNPMKYVDIGGFLRRNKNTGKLEFSPGELNLSDPSTYQFEHKGDWARTWVGRWGTLKTEKGNDIRAFYNNRDGDMGADTNCHGLTFGDGEYWISNDQVQTILDDEYTEVKNTPAQVGDVVVYYDSGTNKDGTPKEGGSIVHSATVTAVDEKGNVTAVSGLGGITQTSQTTPRESGYAPSASKGKVRTTKVFRKNNITEEQRQTNIERAKTFDKAAERQKQKEEKERKKKEKEEEKKKNKDNRRKSGLGGDDRYEQARTREA